MSHSQPAGLLATYNSLTDKHLAGYFNNTRIRRHLLRSGLITRSGRILSEKEYRVNTMKRNHQKHIRECLAQAIFHKVLDMERYRQLEIKRKLDTLARKERIQRLKGELTRQFIEDNVPVLTPHPPTGPKTNRGHSVLAEEGRSSPLTLTAPRPYTAPGNMQPPIRLQPLLSSRTMRNVSKTTSGSKPKTSFLESEAPFPIGGKKAIMKFRNAMDNSQREDLYQLPYINSYHIPVPPSPHPQAEKISREYRLESWRRKRLRPITAPNGLEPLFTRDSGRVYKTAPHSNAIITMAYFGKNVHLCYDDTDFRDEIKVYQQHCGGENLCVYKGKLLEKDTFQFISKRHHGFPFSLTFFLNGIQVNRISSCCEYKHRRSARLGGKRGYFGFVCVEKASPCYRCIIAMGLDRKTSPTRSRKEKAIEKKEEMLRKNQGKLRKDRENALSRRNEDGRETCLSAVCSAEDIKVGVGEVRTAIEEMEWKGKSGEDIWEDDQENTFKYDYEEDFEVDEERQAERAEEEAQAEDQMSTTSNIPIEGEKDNLSLEKEIELSSEKAPDAHDSEANKDDGCSDSDQEDKEGRLQPVRVCLQLPPQSSDSEEEDKQDIKSTSSVSSRSHPYSSESEDESADVCVEAHSGNSAGGSSRSSPSQDLQENDDPGKFQSPVEEPLETEIEEQEVTKVDVDNGPLLTEVGSTDITEEEPGKGTQESTESELKSEQPASAEATAKSELQEEGTAMAEDRKAGLPGVEEEVGQITGEAQAPGHCCSDTAAGLRSAEDGVTPMRTPEVGVGGVMEERAAISSTKQLEQTAGEACMLEKEAAVEEDESLQPEDADKDAGLREKAGREEDEAHHPWDADTDEGLGEKAGIPEVPLGERSPTEEQSPAAEQSTEKGEDSLSTAGKAEASTEGSSRPCKEQLNPTGKTAAEGAVFLSVDPAPDRQGDVDPNRQAFLPAVTQTRRAVSEGEQGLEKAALTESTALHSEKLGEAPVLREAGTPEREETERESSPKPDGDRGKEGELTELENTGPVADTAPEREGDSEEAGLGGEKSATEVLEAEAPLSSPKGEKGASPREAFQGSPEELCKKDARQGVMADTEATREQDPRVLLPGELAAAADREKVERPPTPLREIGSERAEVTGPRMLKTEDTLEEPQVKGEEDSMVTEARSEEEALAPCPEREADAEDREPTRTTEFNEDTRLLEDPPRGRTSAVFEATPQCEKSPPEETETTELNVEEPTAQENEAPTQPGRGLSHDGEELLGAPGPKPAGKAQVPESFVSPPGEQWASKELHSHAGPERPDEEGPLRRQRGDTITTQENLPEGRLTMAGVFSGEGEGEKPQDRECPLSTGTDSQAGQDQAIGPGTVEVQEGLQGAEVGETAAEQREALAEAMPVDGATMANTAPSFGDAQNKTWDRVGEASGETPAEERVSAEDMVPRAEEVTSAKAVVETKQEQKAPEVQASPEDGEGGETKASQQAVTTGEEAGPRRYGEE